MRLKLGNAPVSWGVDYADDARNPPWQQVMDEISQAGFAYTEVGPYGYFPTDSSRLRKEFAARGLTAVAGCIFETLHEPALAERAVAAARQTGRQLSEVGGKFLFIIDHVSPARMSTAGRWADRETLGRPRFDAMIALIDRIADLTLEFGVTPLIHQHAGCYIEFEDEFEAVLAALDARVGICLDTGHMTYAGIDPVAFFRRHSDRVQYMHFKDISSSMHARALREGLSFHAAIAANIFVPLGKGVVRWSDLVKAVDETGYDGTATVEQDIDPTVSLTPLQDAAASLAFLRSVGF